MNIVSPIARAAAVASTDRPTREAAEAAVRTLLRWAGDDPTAKACLTLRPGSSAPTRNSSPATSRTRSTLLERTFEETDGYDEIVVLRDIRLESHCEHHMVPIIGRAHVAYLPHQRVVGISKLARVLDVYARPAADPGEADGADRQYHPAGAAAARASAW